MATYSKNEHEIIGELHYIGAPIKITDTIRKQVIAIMLIQDKRVEYIPFEILNPDGELIGLSVGNKVLVRFRLKGNKHKQDHSKFFAYNQLIGISKI